jgi:hypothetical protein
MNRHGMPAVLICFFISPLYTRGWAQDPISLGVIGVPDKDGVRVTEIVAHGPAELAGLAVGDVLTTIDGKPFKSISERAELMTRKKVGSQVVITYIREGRVAKTSLTLPEWESVMVLWGVTIGAAPPAWSSCPAGYKTPGNNIRACVGAQDNEGLWVYNLIFHDGRPLNIELKNGIVYTISAQLDPDVCDGVSQALARKFGKQFHQTAIMQNGFGARWEGEHYQWFTQDGSRASLGHNLSEPSSCILYAENADSVKRRRANEQDVPAP